MAEAESQEPQNPVKAEPSEIDDPEQKQFEFKMSSMIAEMPEKVRDRFKALKMLYDEGNAIDDLEEAEFRRLEIKYEDVYTEFYTQRYKILSGEIDVPQELVDAFDTRAEELNDEDYKKVEVTQAEVKSIQNIPKGVPGFWLTAMLNHVGIAALIQEKDRPILMYMKDITVELHKEGFGFDLLFHFESNEYFKDVVLKKTYVMAKQNVIEKCQG